MEKNDLCIRLGQNVRLLRQAKAISQEELGILSGLHRTYIGHVERGERNVSLKTIVQLARALEVSPSELLKGVE